MHHKRRNIQSMSLVIVVRLEIPTQRGCMLHLEIKNEKKASDLLSYFDVTDIPHCTHSHYNKLYSVPESKREKILGVLYFDKIKIVRPLVILPLQDDIYKERETKNAVHHGCRLPRHE
jgi:hypothetical protein